MEHWIKMGQLKKNILQLIFFCIFRKFSRVNPTFICLLKQSPEAVPGGCFVQRPATLSKRESGTGVFL